MGVLPLSMGSMEEFGLLKPVPKWEACVETWCKLNSRRSGFEPLPFGMQPSPLLVPGSSPAVDAPAAPRPVTMALVGAGCRGKVRSVCLQAPRHIHLDLITPIFCVFLRFTHSTQWNAPQSYELLLLQSQERSIVRRCASGSGVQWPLRPVCVPADCLRVAVTRRRHRIDPSLVFSSWEELAALDRVADCVVIATPVSSGTLWV
jgi:hypothetical protein